MRFQDYPRGYSAATSHINEPAGCGDGCLANAALIVAAVVLIGVLKSVASLVSQIDKRFFMCFFISSCSFLRSF